MAGLPRALPLLLALPLALSPPPPPGNASLPGCPPSWAPCEAGAGCFLLAWRCDGHPDCEDESDERGCGTATPAEPGTDGASPTAPPGSVTLPTGSAEVSATPVHECSASLGGQGHLWILVTAALLSILVAVGSAAVWGLSKAKSRSDIFGLERGSRQQLMPAKSQTGPLP